MHEQRTISSSFHSINHLVRDFALAGLITCNKNLP